MTDDELNRSEQPGPVHRPGLPRNPRMAKPVARPMELSEAPRVDPAATRRSDEREPEREPQALELDPQAVPEEVPVPEPEPRATPMPKAAVAEPEPEPAAPPTAQAATALDTAQPDFPATIRETLRRVDEAWAAFYAAASRFPAQQMDEHLGDDRWTRKQMLAHVAAWHDFTADRLIKFINTGRPPDFEGDVDQFNATVARRAIGKTAGEVLSDTQSTFNRLRRQMQRLTDAHLRTHESWAAWLIHGNTYGHYDEHWDDLYMPDPTPGSGRR